MKKILALILALAMILAAGLACADTLEITPGTPTNCTFDNFKTYFSLMTSAAGYNIRLDEAEADLHQEGRREELFGCRFCRSCQDDALLRSGY